MVLHKEKHWWDSEREACLLYLTTKGALLALRRAVSVGDGCSSRAVVGGEASGK